MIELGDTPSNPMGLESLDGVDAYYTIARKKPNPLKHSGPIYTSLLSVCDVSKWDRYILLVFGTSITGLGFSFCK